MNNKGFTLLEFLLYIGLVGIILTVSGAIGLNVLFGKAKLMTIEEVSQNARFVMEKISLDIRNAEIIDTPSQGETSSVLTLQKSNGNIEYELVSGVLSRKEGNGSYLDLTSSEVTVTNLAFSNISYSDTPGTVRVQMTMKLVNPENRQEYNFEKTFYTTANIRKK